MEKLDNQWAITDHYCPSCAKKTVWIEEWSQVYLCDECGTQFNGLFRNERDRRPKILNEFRKRHEEFVKREYPMGIPDFPAR